jgi:hypothetical protein
VIALVDQQFLFLGDQGEQAVLCEQAVLYELVAFVSQQNLPQHDQGERTAPPGEKMVFVH